MSLAAFAPNIWIAIAVIERTNVDMVSSALFAQQELNLLTYKATARASPNASCSPLRSKCI